MDKEKLKLIVRNLELLVDSLKAEIYSDSNHLSILFHHYSCLKYLQSVSILQVDYTVQGYA